MRLVNFDKHLSDSKPFFDVYQACFSVSEAMVGDTNLYLTTDEGQDPEDAMAAKVIAEAGIMIGEPDARNKGMGKQAMLLMFKFGISLGIEKFIARVGYDNMKSQTLFQKFLFTETSRSEFFREITYEREVDDKWLEWLNGQISLYQIENYR